MVEKESDLVELTRIKNEMHLRRYATVPLAISEQQMQDAANSFYRVLTEVPDEIKISAYTMVQREDSGSHVGYVRRQGEIGEDGKQKDQKTFFHYHPAIHDLLPQFVDANPIVAEFIEQAKKLHNAARNTLQETLRIMSCDGVPLEQRFFTDDQRKERLYLRFIAYDNATPGETVATGHYDRGALTLALWESTKGLRIGSKEKLNPVQHHPGHAALMAGITAPEDVAELGFKPSWHDVIQEGTTQWKDTHARLSIVYFCNVMNQRQIKPGETHTPSY